MKKQTKIILTSAIIGIFLLGIVLPLYQELGDKILYDNFNDNSLNTTQWANKTQAGGGTASITETGGRLEIDATSPSSGTSSAGIVANYTSYVNYLRWEAETISQTQPSGTAVISVSIGSTILTDVGDGSTTHGDYATGVWELNRTSATNYELRHDGTSIRNFSSISGFASWNVTGSDSGGGGVTVDHNFDDVYLNKPAVEITKNAPANQTSQLLSWIVLNVTTSPLETTTNNVSFYVWYQNGTSFNVSNVPVSSTENATNTTNITGLGVGDYFWNVQACSTLANTTHFCVFDDEGNRTFARTLFQEKNIFYNSTVPETSKESFVVNITTSGSAPTSATLSNNGTNYTATITNGGGNNYNLSKSLLISPGTGNRTWSYYFTLDGQTQQTTAYQQNITATTLGVCNSTLTTRFSNYTFYDEGNQSAALGEIPSSTWTYYLHNLSATKTFTYSNTTDHNYFSFCGTPTTRGITTNYSLQYQGVNYPQRIFAETNTFNTTTKNQSLYLLKVTDGIFVTFQVINNAEQTISGVLANVTRLIDGSNTLVGIGTTGDDGGITYWLNPNFLHTFGFTKTGFPTLITSLFPTQSTYTVTLGSDTSVNVSDYSRGINFTINPKATTSLLNGTNYNFNYSLESDFWTVEKFGFVLSNSTGTIFNTTSATTNGGTLNVVLNTASNQDLQMEYYYVINSSFTNATVSWIVLDTTGSGWGIGTFFTDLNTYLTAGLFGLDNFGLSIIIFLVIFISTGIMSYKFGLTSPEAIGAIVLFLVFFFDVAVDVIPDVNGIPYVPTMLVLLINVAIWFRRIVR